MRSFLIILLAIVVLALGYLGYAHFSGGAVPTFGLPIGGEKGAVRTQILRFFEQLKFKNLSEAKALLYAPNNEDSLNAYVEALLQIPLDDIDVTHFKVLTIELDSLGLRARVSMQVMGLNTRSQQPFDQTVVVFLQKKPELNLWLVDASSVGA